MDHARFGNPVSRAFGKGNDAMGGRDVNNVEFTNPFEYDPVSNSWTTKAATYPDSLVSNIECAVANDSGTDFIYCVGGSQVSTQTETGRVFRYDPVADVITTVATDWPPGDSSTLPGGITVLNNKIYILGGYDVLNGVGSDQIIVNPSRQRIRAIFPTRRGISRSGFYLFAGICVASAVMVIGLTRRPAALRMASVGVSPSCLLSSWA